MKHEKSRDTIKHEKTYGNHKDNSNGNRKNSVPAKVNQPLSKKGLSHDQSQFTNETTSRKRNRRHTISHITLKLEHIDSLNHSM
jgi:hypothetical protein